MKKNIQAGVLLILLAIPVFIFAFLYLFGENKYEVKVLSPKELTVYNPKVVNCEENIVDGVHRIPEFTFTSQDSAAYGLENLKGKIFVTDFFFTKCPSICIEMTSELLRVQEFYKKEPNVQLVSFSVDPTYDSPSVLAEYAEKYNANTHKWNFLTGEAKDIYELARCGFFIVAKPNEEIKNDFIHSDKLVLVDTKGRIRGYYSGTDREDVDRLITEIQVLLQENDS